MHLALIGFGMTLLGPYRDMRSRDDCRSLSGKADSGRSFARAHL